MRACRSIYFKPSNGAICHLSYADCGIGDGWLAIFVQKRYKCSAPDYCDVVASLPKTNLAPAIVPNLARSWNRKRL